MSNPQKLGAGLYAQGGGASLRCSRELGNTILRLRGLDSTGPLCWHLQFQGTYKHTPGLQGGFVECCLLHLLYSCCIVAFCCPQGWQRDREYRRSSRGLLFMSHQISQSSTAGIWSRASAECTPRPWILLAKLLWCPSILFLSLLVHLISVASSWELWTNHRCLWQNLPSGFRGRSCWKGA